MPAETIATSTSPVSQPLSGRFRTLAARLNDLPIFDAQRWPGREWVTRSFAALAAAAVCARKLSNFPAYLAARQRVTGRLTEAGFSAVEVQALTVLVVATEVLETLVLLGYILAWVTRSKPRSVARGFMEVVYPFVVAFLPVTISMSPRTPEYWFPATSGYYVLSLVMVSGVMVGGAVITLTGVMTLRTSFSIMTEARSLIRHGVFRWSRHPIYLGSFISLFGILLLHLHLYTVALFVLIILGQTYRARLEERKLTAVFPEYEEYRRTTGMFLPRLRVPSSAAPERLGAGG